MKARVKATGEIVEVKKEYDHSNAMVEVFYSNEEDSYEVYEKEELDFDVYEKSFPKDDDYWTRLEHQAAIAAMQGILSNQRVIEALINSKATMEQVIPRNAYRFAHALVEKMKNTNE